MSVEAMAAVLHHSRAKGTAKLVLLGIANHMGDGGAWPAVSTLASYANTEARTVQRAIGQLIAKGELRREVQGGGTMTTPDHDRPNRYDVLVECPPWCDRSTQHRDVRKTRQARLWTKGVTPASPPDASVTPPLASASPPPVTPASPKPPTQPDPPGLGTQLQTARPCADCGQDPTTCQARQRTWPPADRHRYSA